MKDDSFEATFVVDLAPAEVWETLTTRTLDADESGDSEVHYVLPGFPSFNTLSIPGASCTLVELEEKRLLRVKKDHHPCAGTEIVIRLEQAETGTRVTVVQSGFGPFLDFAGRDTVFTHGNQIINDFRLYIERGLTVPGTVWRADLGAVLKQTPVGVEIGSVNAGGPGEKIGISAGDLLMTLNGIRLHDLQQLWTVLALTEPGIGVEISWARGVKAMSGEVTF